MNFNPKLAPGRSIRARIDSDWKFTVDSFGFIRVEVSNGIGLNRINFQVFFNKRDWKRFSDWFGLIRIGTDTDIGMIQNISDSIRFNPNESDSILNESAVNFQFAWIRINPDTDLIFGLALAKVRIESHSEPIRNFPNHPGICIRTKFRIDSIPVNSLEFHWALMMFFDSQLISFSYFLIFLQFY